MTTDAQTDLIPGSTPALAATPPLEATQTAAAAGVSTPAFTLDVDVVLRASYAMAHNRQPALRSVVVRNVASQPGGKVTVSISSRWSASPHPPLRTETFVVECPARGELLELSTESVRLDDQALALLDEGAPATVRVEVSDEAGNSVSEEREILVLARNQWNWDLPALTASFVQPHHPAIAEITRAAGALSKARGDHNAIDGYQSGPAGAMKNAEVIFSALQARIPTYINPPASFDEEGQKVRPLDQVLAEGQGTCIDLACAYASCLQAAGLNTVIVIVHGHAFPAFFTVDGEQGELPADVVRDLGTVQALLGTSSGRNGPPVLVPVESTHITKSESTFSDAVRAAKAHLTDRPAGCAICTELRQAGAPVDLHPHLKAAVDVSRSFGRAGIRSLPVRVVEGTVVTVVIDNGPDEVAVVERRDVTTNRVLPATVPARVQQWKNSLLDLSLRNRLLNFNAEKQGIALLAPEGSLGDIEDALVAGHSIEILDETQISDVHRRFGLQNARGMKQEELKRRWKGRTIFGVVDTGTVQARTKRVMSAARLDKQDTAVNNLNLALGSVTIRGGGSQGKDLVAPVFLVPVEVKWNRGRTAPVVTMDDAAISGVNHCLLEWLRAKQGMKLEWFRADMRDGSGLDIQRGLDEIRKEAVNLGLSDRIIVTEAAAVALLRFDKIRLWKDLDDHWELFAASPVVAHLVKGSQGGFTDAADPEGKGAPAFDDATLRNPTSADGAQTAAIVRALSGQSFILEGPPGTGKSQTITNLLANALSEGKRVLFVAQKQAALEVVQERLEESGLAPYCLDLHDKGSSLESIKAQLRGSLDSLPDLAALDRWDRLEQEFEATARALDLYRARLHAPNEQGTSFSQAHLSRLELSDGPRAQLTRSVLAVDRDHLERARAALVDLWSVTNSAKPSPRHPWRFSTASSLSSVDRASLAGVIAEIGQVLPAVGSLVGPWAEVARACHTGDELTAVGSAMSLVAQGGRPLPAHEWAAVAHPGWRLQAEADVSTAVDALRGAAALDPAWGLPDVLAPDHSAQLAEVQAAASSFVLGRKKRIRRALGSFSASPALADHRTAAAAFESLHAHSTQYRAAVARLADTPGLRSVGVAAQWPTAQQADQLRWWIEHLAAAARVIATGSQVATSAAHAMSSAPCTAESADAVVRLARAMRRVATLTSADPAATSTWCAGRGLIAAITDANPAWHEDAEALNFLRLSRWSNLQAHLSVLAVGALAEFRVQLLDGTITAEDSRDAFDRAYLDVLLRVIGQQHEFDVFDGDAHDALVARFADQLRRRQELLRAVIPASLHERRTFDAHLAVGAVGRLRTELNSKRRGARSVRTLVNNHHELITQLTPCFLMSPDSVAKFLEPQRIQFDLVVFDEASQITVPDAIGAMGRAASVVIVGDSKQMPPTSMFAAGGSREDDERTPTAAEAVPEDAESVLEECVESGLPRQMLSWHYRSQDEVLISFSNERYYEGKLASFPNPTRGSSDCGLAWHRVAGQFDHGRSHTNPIEADAIVTEIHRRLHDPELSRWSMGVVTLNLQQAELIRSKLAALQDPLVTELLESDDKDKQLIVLNLESVQGRERDVILLGTSFSKRANGDAMPLNFGPLNQKRGERRLNVAVTRARRQVLVFSSFDPEELAAAKSVGMVHLREYLELARRVTEDADRAESAGSAAPTDLHTADVASALRARGLIVRESYGLSDFKVDLAVTLPGHEDRWLGAVLLDGPGWGRRELALDRDALPLTVLKGMLKWPVVARVWLPAWLLERDAVVSAIHDLVTKAAEEPVEPAAVAGPIADAGSRDTAVASDRIADAVPASDVKADTRSAVPSVRRETHLEPKQVLAESPAAQISRGPGSGRAPSGRPGQALERPYWSWQPPTNLGAPDALSRSGMLISRHLTAAANVEGPLPLDSALRSIAKGFGLKQVRENRLAEIRRFAPRRATVRTGFGIWLFPEQYVAPDGTVTADFDWYRPGKRAIQDVAPHEIANAMVQLARSAHSISMDELVRETLTIFGYSRRGADAVAHTAAVAEWAIRQGLLTGDSHALRAA